MIRQLIHFNFSVALLLSLTHLTACAHMEQRTEQRSANSPETLYKNALVEFDNGLYPEAIKQFMELEQKHPYAQSSRLAMLRIADAYLKQGQFPDAIAKYQDFIRFYPQHENAPYAKLQIGNTYYEQIPENWWFLPPSSEKDLTNIRKAITAYKQLTSQYSSSPQASKAIQNMKKCRQKLAEHEFYVAQFYFNKKKYKATIERANYLLKHYQKIGFDSQILLLKAQAHMNRKEDTEANLILSRILNDYTDSPQATKAKQLMQK